MCADVWIGGYRAWQNILLPINYRKNTTKNKNKTWGCNFRVTWLLQIRPGLKAFVTHYNIKDSWDMIKNKGL